MNAMEPTEIAKEREIRKKLQAKAHSENYMIKMREYGLERTIVMVPVEDIEKVRAYARKLRIAAGKPLLTD